MHPIQSKILEISKTNDLGKLKLREIGLLVGEPHPQKIKHHLNQLSKRGFLIVDKKNDIIKRIGGSQNEVSDFITIPIFGAANCGVANIFADEKLEGYLKVSKNILKNNMQNIFALRASGDSMNNARIHNESIEDGDYVLVNGDDRDAKPGDYVVSIIDNCANIKKFQIDKSGENERIILVSESKKHYPPIYIDSFDFEEMKSYMISGKVVQVIKKPSMS